MKALIDTLLLWVNFSMLLGTVIFLFKRKWKYGAIWFASHLIVIALGVAYYDSCGPNHYYDAKTGQPVELFSCFLGE